MYKNEINIVTISNIVLEPYFKLNIKKEFSENVNIYTINYSENIDFIYSEIIPEVDLIVILLNFEVMFYNKWRIKVLESKMEKEFIKDVYSVCIRLCSKLEQKSNARILFFLFEDYFTNFHVFTGNIPQFYLMIDKLNAYLYHSLKKSNIVCIDLKRLIAYVGTLSAYNIKNKYRWNAPYSNLLIEVITKELHKQYLIENGITKKCIVLDCDNVLWGGILSEDGIENIKLSQSGQGKIHQEFQRFLLQMYYHGVILTICSKNDLSDVLFMFREHNEMILKEEQIAYFCVNWENKPDNIRFIAEKLNIGLDSVVFIDDSDIEVEAVRALLPNVTSIKYESNTIYRLLSCFNISENINKTEINKRNETYRTDKFREKLKLEYENYNDYVSALNVKVDIHKIFQTEVYRISELTQRTNKCTTGKRYTVSEINDRLENEDVSLYSISASDRFSDLGIVGALEVENDMLTLFSLSCRALGREIDRIIFSFLTEKHEINYIEFYPTKKNDEIKIMLQRLFPTAIFKNE